jgi:hypothetical protein
MGEALYRYSLQEGPVLPSIRIPLLACLCLGAAGTLAAQTSLSPSPTLPSDTLEANYAPRSAPGPMPEVSPSLPSDTLEATQPVDSFPTDPFVDDSVSDGNEPLEPFAPDSAEENAAPDSAADRAALRDLQSWMDRHPELMAPHPGLIAPPPPRAVLVRV